LKSLLLWCADILCKFLMTIRIHLRRLRSITTNGKITVRCTEGEIIELNVERQLVRELWFYRSHRLVLVWNWNLCVCLTEQRYGYYPWKSSGVENF
jgi:hypothetical protein